MQNDIHTETILVFMTIGASVMLLLALSLVLFFLFSQRKLHQEQLKAQISELRHQEELVQRNLSTQEEERRRIAVNLHDDIGSKLGVLNLTLHRLRRTLPSEQEQVNLFDEIHGVITGAMESARKISHGLLPPTLEDFGLVEALGELCESIRKTGAIQIQFETNLERSDISDKAVELNLFRIAQELTNNTLKYAQARHITMSLTKQNDMRLFHYADDGVGFDRNTVRSRGLGMKNLESRVKIIQGTCEIQTAPGKGFEVNIQF